MQEPVKAKPEEFVSNKDTVFEIKAHTNGLYHIVSSSGGPRAPLLEEKFTSYKLAKAALEKHIAKGDRGYAKYPSKKAA